MPIRPQEISDFVLDLSNFKENLIEKIDIDLSIQLQGKPGDTKAQVILNVPSGYLNEAKEVFELYKENGWEVFPFEANRVEYHQLTVDFYTSETLENMRNVHKNRKY